VVARRQAGRNHVPSRQDAQWRIILFTLIQVSRQKTGRRCPKPLTKADAIEAKATILYMFGESDYADEFYRKLAGKILKVPLPDNQAVAAVRREKPPGRLISPASILPNKLCNSSELLSSANLEKGSTSRHLFPILHLRLSAVGTGK